MTTVLERADKNGDYESSVESPSVQGDIPPMTLKQWLQVLSAFAVFLNTW